MRLPAFLPMRAALAVVWSVGLACGPAVSAEAQDTDASDYDDCTRIELDLEAGAGALTDEERIALMDREFYESLARFDRCQASFSSNGGGGGEGGGDGGGDGDGEDGSADGDGNDGGQGDGQGDGQSDGPDNPVQSVPSASVSGTEPEQPPTQGVAQEPPALQPATAGDVAAPQDNGKTPDDIPAADNDDVIAQQLRKVAENEQDPEQREKLWNEYRKYKNLPVKKAPSKERPAREQSE